MGETVENEFAAVDVRVDRAANGPRLRLEDRQVLGDAGREQGVMQCVCC